MNKIAENLPAGGRKKLSATVTQIFHIVNELTHELCENPVEKVLKTGTIITLANHTVLISRDGREMAIIDSGAPIKDKDSRQ